jgi:Holliday junction resolvasome RuvABC ATP-dependent DNA helicase subunit
MMKMAAKKMKNDVDSPVLIIHSLSSNQPHIIMFNDLIGQDHIKNSLSFYVDGAKRGGAVPPILFTGARGLGKTEFARKMAKALKKPLLELNCSTIKNNTQFFEQIFVPVVMNNEIVLIFDECHALPRELQNAFLTVFNVEKSSRKQFEWQGSTMEFDFTKQTYLFATTEPDKIFTPLKDRFEEIDFRPYTDNELGKILQKRADWVALDGSLVPVIAETLRGNARSAVKRAKQIEMFCENKNISKFGANEWKQMCGVLGIKPNGLTNAEVQVLQILKERGACTLAMLSAATGMSRTALQRDIEMHLLRKGYMKIEGLRMITGAGQNALSKV